MQKLSGIVDLSVKMKKMPVLTKKSVREQWNTSAFLALGKGIDRGKRRRQGIHDEAYVKALGETIKVGAPPEMDNLNGFLGSEKRVRQGRLSQMWDQVFFAGGARYSVPGHSLYLKAILRGQLKVFAVGDPIIDKYEFLTIPEMNRYVEKRKKLDIETKVIDKLTSTVAYVKGATASLYSSVYALEKAVETPKDLPGTAIFYSAESKKGGAIFQVEGILEDGNNFAGAVQSGEIVLLPAD